MVLYGVKDRRWRVFPDVSPSRSNDASDLSRAVREARRLAAAANALLKLRLSSPLPQEKKLSFAALELLLILSGEGGSAPITLLAERASASTRQILSTLKEMEELGLVKVIETPTRVGALLSSKGQKVAFELIRAFGLE
jgi:predicted transcriptional regulator